MAQQTAVEFLISRLMPLIDFSSVEERKKFRSIIQQAKAMEKEQICNARIDGFKISGEGWNGEFPFEGKDDSIISEKIENNKYYNETYESK